MHIRRGTGHRNGAVPDQAPQPSSLYISWGPTTLCLIHFFHSIVLSGQIHCCHHPPLLTYPFVDSNSTLYNLLLIVIPRSFPCSVEGRTHRLPDSHHIPRGLCWSISSLFHLISISPENHHQTSNHKLRQVRLCPRQRFHTNLVVVSMTMTSNCSHS